ncbi:MAG TPA: hypothetical protein VHK65_12115 [Candidatus Dormibacteraeota bacterium]|nr:hypothetical protein [Candidatus Dormibacteraeota bacterium]
MVQSAQGPADATHQKLSIVAGMLVGFYVLGLLLQVTGLLR